METNRRTAQQHTAHHQGEALIVCYPYHPLSGQRVLAFRTETVQGVSHYRVVTESGRQRLVSKWIRCGCCGKKMQVQYGGRSGCNHAAVYYLCRASQEQEIGLQNCSLFGGVNVEQAVVEAVLEALSPLRMEALVQASEQLVAQRREKREQVELELERTRYKADRCQRQYNKAEPENRLVVRTLESRWNQALERVSQLEQE